MKKIVLAISCLLLLLMTYCSVNRTKADLPGYFPKTVYDFGKNPLAQKKVELGRALFYDPLLSRDNSTSCASCHAPFNGFAHTDHELSHGIDNRIGTRNAPALQNLAWNTSFMWDGSIQDLDRQALTPIIHPNEMGEKIDSLLLKLRKSESYPALFFQAFGDSSIRQEHLLKAIAQFQLTLISSNSKYDQVKRNKASFTEQELKGYQLFQKNCHSCHAEPLFSTYEFANNGLAMDTFLRDTGRYAVTGARTDSLKFKIPSLRNLSYTFPYMHDGRFKKLSQVLNHYTSGITHGPTLAPELKNKIALTSNEKTDLIAFLLTLNDPAFIFNPKHQFPKDHPISKRIAN
jgi:cytochrome c peroxidase